VIDLSYFLSKEWNDCWKVSFGHMQHGVNGVMTEGDVQQTLRTFEISSRDLTTFGSSSMTCSVINKHISGTNSMPVSLLNRFHELGIPFLISSGSERPRSDPRRA